MSRTATLFLAALMLLMPLAQPAKAQSSDPVQMLKTTTSRLLSAIDKNRDAIRKDPKHLEQLVREIVLPHVDLTVFARSVAGRHHWLDASPATRRAFEDELVGYIVRTYASAFSAYKGQKVLFLPYRGDLSNKTRIVIQSRVESSKGKPVDMEYRLLKRQNGWKVYDISVDGVSMVKSYRAQFSSIMDQKGLSGLVKELKAKNK